jgi:hypothetical protein
MFDVFDEKMARKQIESGVSRKKQVSLYMWSGVGCRKNEKQKCERLKHLHVLLVISICNSVPFRTNEFVPAICGLLNVFSQG